MIVTPLKTPKVLPGTVSLEELINSSLLELHEGSILAITSKIVSLCENRVEDMTAHTKEELVRQESDRYTTAIGPYNFRFTIMNNTLIPAAGIDESNSGEYYVLWPRDPQGSANRIRQYLTERYGVRRVGIVITDSTSMIMRRGTVGIALAHSGFAALHSYIGQPDLFGRPFVASVANVASGLAAAAVTVMGEGSEQTPLAVIADANFVQFQERDPSPEELNELRIEAENDIFAPFLAGVKWSRGRGGKDSGVEVA